MRKSFVIFLAFAASAALAQQPDYSKVEVKAAHHGFVGSATSKLPASTLSCQLTA